MNELESVSGAVRAAPADERVARVEDVRALGFGRAALAGMEISRYAAETRGARRRRSDLAIVL
jgi:hypothetical protein